MNKVARLLKGGVLDEGVDDIQEEGPSSTNKTTSKVGRIMFLGDVALARRIGEQIERYGAAYPFAKLPSNFFGADIVVFNLECCLSVRGSSWEPKPVLMRGKAEYLDVFPRQQQRYVANVANNHFLDFGEVGAMDTIEALKAAGLFHIGADGELTNSQPLVLQTPGGSVALLAFAPCAHRLSGKVRVNVAPELPRDIVKAVEQAHGCADLLVVSLHQGVEHCRFTHRWSRQLARDVVEAGADLVVVHHTHVIQGIEQVRDGVIFHGIGNFLLDVPQERRPAAAHTLAVRIEIVDGKIKRISAEPLEMNEEWQPVVLEGPSRDNLFLEVKKLSLLFDSKIGVAINNAGAWKRWFAHKLSGSWLMIQRVGARKTALYYLGRVVKKLAARLAWLGTFR